MHQAPQHEKKKLHDLLRVLHRVDEFVKGGNFGNAAKALADAEDDDAAPGALKALQHRLQLAFDFREKDNLEGPEVTVALSPIIASLRYFIALAGHDAVGGSQTRDENNVEVLKQKAGEVVDSSPTEALNWIARALQESPEDEESLLLEAKIRARVELLRKSRENKVREEEEEKSGRHKLFDVDSTEREAVARKAMEEASRQAREHKIRHSLQKVRESLRNGLHENALGQLAIVQALDPSNENVVSLHQQILGRMKKAKDGKFESNEKVAEGFKSLIRKEVDKAENHAKHRQFDEAFRILTQAYRIDPVSAPLVECENRVIEAREEAFKLEEQHRLESEKEHRRREEAVVNHLSDAEMVAKLNKDLEEANVRHQEEIAFLIVGVAKAYGYARINFTEEALAELGSALSLAKPDQFAVHLPKLEELDGGATVQADEEPQYSDEDAEPSEDAKTILSLYSPFMEDKPTETPGFTDEPSPAEAEELSIAEIVTEQRHKSEEGEKENIAVEMSLKTARECLAREELPEAMAWVEYALRFAGNRPDVMQLRDELDRKFNEWQAVKANQQGPLVIHLHLSNAFDLLIQGKTKEALQEVNSALAIEPNHQEALSLKAQVLRKVE